MIDLEQRRQGLLRRVVRKAAEIVPMSLLPARMIPRLDSRVFRLTRGRSTLSAWLSGLPIVMLTTRGARSGQPRTLPILGLPDGDRLVVIASNFGRQQHPGWYYNLRAHPRVLISWKGSTVEMRARELTGNERQRYLTLSHATYPWWEQYHHRAAPRQIPVIMLEPLGPSQDVEDGNPALLYW
jgi:deazaflavin-dependent oxidoreductase (nitroreductase family)